MPSLPPTDFISVLKHLNAATGYLGLGMHMEAWNELEEIDADKRALPEVLNVRVEVCRALERWEMMLELCRHLQEAEPNEAEGSGQRRQLSQTEENRELYGSSHSKKVISSNQPYTATSSLHIRFHFTRHLLPFELVISLSYVGVRSSTVLPLSNLNSRLPSS